jgi:DNA-binding IclR family transcriptional regulator
VGRTGPMLDDLADATGETVHLARLEGSHVVYTAKRESVHPLRMFSAVGRRLPAYATALGRSILADLPEDQVRAILPPDLEPLTAHTITNPDQIIGILAEVRRDGYAIEREESCLGMSCFAVSLPVSGAARYAISISVPVARLDDRARSSAVENLLAARGRFARQPFRHQGGPNHD